MGIDIFLEKCYLRESVFGMLFDKEGLNLANLVRRDEMSVKTSDVHNHKYGTPEYVVLHGKWRQSRGKEPSATLCFEKNPRRALEIAMKYVYFPIGKGGQYLGGIAPLNYVCCRCNVHGVKLWRRYQTCKSELLCAQCAATDQCEDISGLRSDGKRPSELSGFTDQIGWFVPAVPCEDIDGWWGYTSVPGPGVDWWRNLPNFAG